MIDPIGRARGQTPTMPREPALAWALALMVLTVVGKAWLLDPVGPVLFFDELLYRQAAEAIANLARYPTGQYPFGYPAVISPAFAVGAGYAGVFWINTLLTSALVPGCFLLARSIRSPYALLSALLAALLPIQAVFPTQLVSENLFIPAIVLVVWFAIRGRCESRISAFLYGLALASLFLTKYLALPAIPVIWAFWLFGVQLQRRTGERTSEPPVRAIAIWSAAAVVIGVGSWLVFANYNGISLMAASSKVSGIHAPAISAKSIGMWACAYLAVLVLIMSPFLPNLMDSAIAVAKRPLAALREDPVDRLFALFVLLTGGFWMVATLHSSGGADNYPVPQRVVARYLMFVAPLLVVLGPALVARGATQVGGRFGWIAITFAAIAAVLVAHGILYKDLVWQFPDWFASIPLYSSDLLSYRNEAIVAVLLATMLVGALASVDRSVRVAWMVMLILLFGTCLINADHKARALSSVRPVHAKVLVPLVRQALRDHDSVVVVAEIRGEPARVMRNALAYWGIPRNRVRVVDGADWQRAEVSTQPVLLQTARRLPMHPLLVYRYGTRTAYVYRLDAKQQSTAVPAPVAGVVFRTEGQVPCRGGAAVEQALVWDLQNTKVKAVAVYVLGEQGERLFLRGGPRGRKQTGRWVRDTTTFRARAADSGRVLAEWVVLGRPCP
jgi:hypothetical protein